MLEPSGFREIVRSVTTSYPIPLALALCLAFAVCTLAGAVWTEGALRWVLVGFAGTTTLFSLSLFGWAAVSRPELLRSERHQIAHRVLDLLEGDSDLPPKAIDSVGKLLSAEPRTKGQGGHSGS